MAQVFRTDDDIRALWAALTGDGLIGVLGQRPQVQARLALLKAIVQAEDLDDRYRMCTYSCASRMTMGLIYDTRRYPRTEARFVLDRCLATATTSAADCETQTALSPPQTGVHA
ncbi:MULTISPECIES: hypothetical protein [Lysobacter]|uniref:Uncharacterized protein n=1 Tax=Lysobacter firmicutimachus TaxID=1792846 RepID=A0ABU8D8Y7_9GAMM|nr:hypothetical protein [Lysobacter antibioticus]